MLLVAIFHPFTLNAIPRGFEVEASKGPSCHQTTDSQEIILTHAGIHHN